MPVGDLPGLSDKSGWSELKYPDLSASDTNPFITVFPETPLPRMFDTRGDIEVLALVGHALAERTGDRRFADLWKFVDEGRTDVYLQRILDHSSLTRGYRLEDLEEKARIGCDHYLDDSEEACAALFKAGKRVTMVAWPWNSGLSSPAPEMDWNWPRVASIAEWEP